MVFSATKGVAATVIHRLADRGLIDYDAPIAEYWTEFGANGKADITVREMLRHRAGLAHLNGVRKSELLDHRLMEERIAAAPVSRQRGKPAYHALTYGWLVSGLARAVTGKGMRQLIREEVAEPLNTDGLHLGRPGPDSATRPAQIIHPQLNIPNPLFNIIAPRAALHPLTAGFGALYFPGMKAVVQGLLEALTGVPHHGERFALTRDLTRELSGAPRLIVVDEAQRLNHDAVETLRMLHDHPDTRFALALVGGNGCWEVLSAHPMLRSRIYRRVAFTRLEWKELAVILPAYHPIYRDADRELLVLVDEAYARGSFRAWAVFTRTAAGLLEPGQALTEQAVRNSFALLGGNDAAD